MYGKLLTLLLAVLLICSATSLARDIAPAEPPPRVTIGQGYDPRVPVYVPKFASQRAIPAGLAERQWAIQFTTPSFGPGFGCFGFGYCWPFNGFRACYYGGYLGGCGTWSPGCSIQSGCSLP